MNDSFTYLHSDQGLTSNIIHLMSNTASTTGIKIPVLYIEVHESVISVLHITKKLSKMEPKVMPKSKRQCQNMLGYLKSGVHYLEVIYVKFLLEILTTEKNS